MVSITQPLNRMKHKRKGSERTWTRRIREPSIINGHEHVQVQLHMWENTEKTSPQALVLFDYLDSRQGLGSSNCCGWQGQNSWPYCCCLRHWCCVVGGWNPVVGSHMIVCVHLAASDIIYPLLVFGRLMVVTNKPTCWVQYVRMCLQMLVLLQCIQIFYILLSANQWKSWKLTSSYAQVFNCEIECKQTGLQQLDSITLGAIIRPPWVVSARTSNGRWAPR